MKERAYRLMKKWCDTLLEYRVTSASEDIDGALLCPACHTVHGRIADLVLPLTLLYVREGDKKYLEVADRFVSWSERCLLRPDGSWRNDAISEWKGVSAFFAISLADSLLTFGDKLPREVYDRWLAAFIHLTDFIYNTFFTLTDPVINYYAGSACHLAIANKLLGEDKYLTRARELEANCRRHFDECGIFFGEGKKTMEKSAHGCRWIDMGYDLEESLPILLKYAHRTGEGFDFYRERMRDHLPFILPDGAIDNSFGSRHAKWTYWGSRTADGAIEGLGLLCDEPVFREAASRVLSAYERYTVNGLLAMPMARESGEPICIHHTFCHAKALASFIIEADCEKENEEPCAIPSELPFGIKAYQSGNLALISVHGWRATVSAIDMCRYDGAENSAGSMTLLYKDGLPRIAATMRKYNPVEPHNMQFLRHSDQTGCMTPRIVFDNGRVSLSDYADTTLEIGDSEVCAKGRDFTVNYRFGEDITLTVTATRPATFMLPLIKWEEARLSDGCVRLAGLCVYAQGVRLGSSGFNQVGGFIYQSIEIPIAGTAEITLRYEK